MWSESLWLWVLTPGGVLAGAAAAWMGRALGLL